MNQSKQMQQNRQFSAKAGRQDLEKKLRHLVSDSIRGRYDHEEQQHDPRTGRPWIQKQSIKLFGINGTALVDGFETFGERFMQLKPETVLERVRNGCGLFVTTDPLQNDEFCPEFVTHHITEDVSLDRLRFQIAEAFDLAFLISWHDKEFAANIYPMCVAEIERKNAAAHGHAWLRYRIGTEAEFRRILRSGLRMNHGTTMTSHRLQEWEKDLCAVQAVTAIQTFVTEIFDIDVKWGVASTLPVDETAKTRNEAPTLLSLEENMMMDPTVPEIEETRDDEPEMPELEPDALDTMFEELSNDPNMMPAQAGEKNAVLV